MPFPRSQLRTAFAASQAEVALYSQLVDDADEGALSGRVAAEDDAAAERERGAALALRGAIGAGAGAGAAGAGARRSVYDPLLLTHITGRFFMYSRNEHGYYAWINDECFIVPLRELGRTEAESKAIAETFLTSAARNGCVNLAGGKVASLPGVGLANPLPANWLKDQRLTDFSFVEYTLMNPRSKAMRAARDKDSDEDDDGDEDEDGGEDDNGSGDDEDDEDEAGFGRSRLSKTPAAQRRGTYVGRRQEFVHCKYCPLSQCTRCSPPSCPALITCFTPAGRPRPRRRRRRSNLP